MKKFTNTLATITLGLALLTACHRGQTTTMVINDGENTQKIEYRGKVIFNEAQNGIEHITDNGYLKYERNGEKFEAETDEKGRIVYSFNGDSKITNLSDEQKEMLTDAIKNIVKQRAKQKGY